MPKRLYYILRDGKRIDGADRLCDIHTLLAYHQKRQPMGDYKVTLYDGYEVC